MNPLPSPTVPQQSAPLQPNQRDVKEGYATTALLTAVLAAVSEGALSRTPLSNSARAGIVAALSAVSAFLALLAGQIVAGRDVRSAKSSVKGIDLAQVLSAVILTALASGAASAAAAGKSGKSGRDRSASEIAMAAVIVGVVSGGVAALGEYVGDVLTSKGKGGPHL